MSTNIDYAVASFIDMANNNIQKAIELAKENSPELINQILLWGVASNIIWVVASILFVPLVIWGYAKLVKDSDFDDEFFLALLGVGTAIFSLVGIIGSIAAVAEIVKIKVAPALFLFDYFTSAIR